jgi:5,6-dimethylbenzimidazole synthase
VETTPLDIYEAIYLRRDVREFIDRPVPDDLLTKILDAAHHAGSVGFMQPWNFIVVRSPATKDKVYQSFVTSNVDGSKRFSGERAELYKSLKLEGIREAPINIAVTCDRSRGGPHTLGRNTIPEMDIYSTCCAVQNLWLAARAEGVGVGWVSILDPNEVKSILQIPSHVTLVAYLCVGYPVAFLEKPLLEKVGWRDRLPLADVVSYETWPTGVHQDHDSKRMP